jgi:tol-pal system protein YbgF
VSKRASFVAVALLATVAHAAHAAFFQDDEARQRIDATNQRLGELQQQIESRLTAVEQQLKGQGLADLANQVEVLQSDIAKLRGQVEVLTYELDQAQKRQRDLYVDLDTRLRKLEASAAPGGAGPAGGGGDVSAPGAGPAAVPAPGAGAAAMPPPGGSFGPAPNTVATAPAVPPAPAPVRSVGDPAAEQRAYDAALDKFKRGDYQGAIAGFGAFVKAYPRSALAPSAQYWLGNAQYARRDYRGSIATQRQLLLNWPDSSKAPDAMLNVASAQSDMGDNAAARKTLEELIRKYPKSDAATKARQRLGVR